MLEPPAYDRAFVARVIASHLHFTGSPLVPAEVAPERAIDWLYDDAPFAVLAHDTDDDPKFVFANRYAQRCFERTLAELVGMPSRLSAEAPLRTARAAALARVERHGFVHDYRGVRVAKSGRRFWIERGTLFNVLSDAGERIGQAAVFRSTAPA